MSGKTLQPPLRAGRFAVIVLLMLSAAGLLARENPLFKLKDPANILFRYGAYSENESKGGGRSRLRLVDRAGERFAFVRAEVDIPAGPATAAGIRFRLEEVRTPDEDGKLLLRLRASEHALPIKVAIRDVAGQDHWVDLAAFGGAETGWRYYEIPFAQFKPTPIAPDCLLDSLTLSTSRTGASSFDLALIGVDSP